MILWLILCTAGIGFTLLIILIVKFPVFPLDYPGFAAVSKAFKKVIVLLHAKNKRILFASPGVKKMFGVSFPSIMFDTIVSSIHADDIEGFRNLINNPAQHQDETEFRIQKKDTVSWIRMKAVPASSRFAAKIVLLFEDITQQKQNDLQLAQARDYEVSVGARIQQALLLGAPVKGNKDLEISAMSIPSQQIDGDFYDFFEGAGNQLDIILGDVMGKGVPAALTGAAAKNAFLRARMEIADKDSTKGLSLTNILSKADSFLAEQLIQIGTFLTLVYGRIDTEAKLFRYVDCGHTSIIHYDAFSGHCWRMKGANMPIGFSASQEYREYLLPTGSNDILFFFSDGISEAESSEGGMFGEERIVKLIKTHSALDAVSLLEKIKQLTFQFSAGNFRDDVTGIVAKVVCTEQWKEVREQNFSLDLSSLRDIREFITSWLTEIHDDILTASEKDKIAIAAGEAVSNILKHNTQSEQTQCSAVCRRDNDWLCISLLYNGKDFDWHDPKMPDLMKYQTGGYGLSLMNETMDSMTVSQGDEGAIKIELLYLLDQAKGNTHGTV